MLAYRLKLGFENVLVLGHEAVGVVYNVTRVVLHAELQASLPACHAMRGVNTRAAATHLIDLDAICRALDTPGRA